MKNAVTIKHNDSNYREKVPFCSLDRYNIIVMLVGV